MTPSKDHNYFAVNKLKDMKISDLPDKEFKIAVLKKLNDLHENTKKIQEN